MRRWKIGECTGRASCRLYLKTHPPPVQFVCQPIDLSLDSRNVALHVAKPLRRPSEFAKVKFILENDLEIFLLPAHTVQPTKLCPQHIEQGLFRVGGQAFSVKVRMNNKGTAENHALDVSP